MCVCVTPVCVGVCIRSVHLEVRGQPWVLFFLQVPFAFDLRQGLSLELDFVTWARPSGSCTSRDPCLCLPSLSLTLFYMVPGDLNSDPHMCKTSTLPTELSLQPICLQFLQQNLYLDRCETLCFLNYFLQGKYLGAQLQNC